MSADLRGSVAIVGVGHAGLGEAHGRSELEILTEAAHNAVNDAGLNMRDIDGIATASVNATMWVLPVAEYLGIHPKFVDSTMMGGSSFVTHMLPAALALNAGLCDAVLVCYGSTQRTATFGRKESVRLRPFVDPMPYECPYHPAMPVSGYALAAARHMHQYGTTREQLAEVAVAARRWAQRNPEAYVRSPLSIKDVLGSRMHLLPPFRRRIVEVHSLADELHIVEEGQVIAVHQVMEGRGQRRIAAGHRSLRALANGQTSRRQRRVKVVAGGCLRHNSPRHRPRPSRVPSRRPPWCHAQRP